MDKHIIFPAVADANDGQRSMKQGIVMPELNNTLSKMILNLKQRELTKEFLKDFYHVDTYKKANGDWRLQGHIYFDDMPIELPKWMDEAVDNTELAIVHGRVLLEVWNVIIPLDLPF